MDHPDAGSILDLTVGELLRRLGSPEPAPGGGAAAAIAGALGAALVQMTANLTIGQRQFAAVDEQARRIEAAAADLRERFSKLADADAEAFLTVRAAYRLPRETEVEKAARSAAIQAALQLASSIPLQTAVGCAELLELAEKAAPMLNAAVLSDVLVGAQLARAALESAAINVEINLAAMTDAEAADRLSRDLDRARNGAEERVERVLEVGRSRFPRPARKV